ncbi:hypothetical protein Barb6XT_00106 [Bacteroidales bacterium Barb6XT]|nr:hypothetical protein Barb6XT_00106 [Bacteroidales bacterium Barb6XT]
MQSDYADDTRHGKFFISKVLGSDILDFWCSMPSQLDGTMIFTAPRGFSILNDGQEHDPVFEFLEIVPQALLTVDGFKNPMITVNKRFSLKNELNK